MLPLKVFWPSWFTINGFAYFGVCPSAYWIKSTNAQMEVFLNILSVFPSIFLLLSVPFLCFMDFTEHFDLHFQSFVFYSLRVDINSKLFLSQKGWAMYKGKQSAERDAGDLPQMCETCWEFKWCCAKLSHF